MSWAKIQAQDKGSFKAYIAMPDSAPAPAVIMIQEIFGINQEMRDKCDQMAKLGYIAIAPDLFWRIQPGIELVDSKPEQLKRAFQLFGEFNIETGLSDLEATLNHIRVQGGCNGKVGCIGYCLGGNLAYRMATGTDIDASVGYYGVGIENMLDETDRIQNPLLLHIAGNDEFVTREAQDKIIETLIDHKQVQAYRYEGMDHAFARGGGMHYNEDAAELANERSFEFLERHLK